jgi:hypothetical protein
MFVRPTLGRELEEILVGPYVWPFPTGKAEPPLGMFRREHDEVEG